MSANHDVWLQNNFQKHFIKINKSFAHQKPVRRLMAELEIDDMISMLLETDECKIHL